MSIDVTHNVALQQVIEKYMEIRPNARTQPSVIDPEDIHAVVDSPEMTCGWWLTLVAGVACGWWLMAGRDERTFRHSGRSGSR